MKRLQLWVCIVLFFLTSQTILSAQSRQITGLIVDANGNGITYATIKVRETKELSATNEQGKFSVKAFHFI